ncbi:zinc transport system ATP-binding protein [Lipingzhangella halophila]|uniref:Zinc transport system ATP-binding protein n=1 Tax=Lipingzhangella halophila TaxID=1783352 RepID=A0A7W7RF93_9ACTN|nr:ATP-binding cassette domain-containing protein [Lipingzhangella halophila]MBB4930341.1 zinc transport system ATP-binding protein [Lipingzhangella halophila]
MTNAVVSYNGSPAVRDASFDVPVGDTLAILGPNGSGKSTLMRAMLGVLPLTRGQVEVHGVPLRRFRDWGRIGYVPQRLSAGGGVPATVRETVASGQVSRRRRYYWATKEDNAAVDDAMAAVGLADRARDSAHELSGGQQQRVLIARALAGLADTFIMDEPMSGVDNENQQALAGIIGRLSENGATVILVLHELGPLRPLLRRVISLSGGQIAYDGPPNGSAGDHHDHVHPHAGADPSMPAVPAIEVPRRA